MLKKENTILYTRNRKQLKIQALSMVKMYLRKAPYLLRKATQDKYTIPSE